MGARRVNGVSDLRLALRGWLALNRVRVGRKLRPDRGGISARAFYAEHLRFRDLAFDIGANIGTHTEAMLRRGARVVAVEPQRDLAAVLTSRFPEVTVVPLAVSDQPGTAHLHVPSAHRNLATLNDAWTTASGVGSKAWDREELVPLTTIDRLIECHGQPEFIKIDTEGLEDRVLRGLTQPIKQLLFEVHSNLPEVATRAVEHLDALGRYEYRVMERHSWRFGDPLISTALLQQLPDWGDVHARRVDASVR